MVCGNIIHPMQVGVAWGGKNLLRDNSDLHDIVTVIVEEQYVYHVIYSNSQLATPNQRYLIQYPSQLGNEYTWTYLCTYMTLYALFITYYNTSGHSE